MFEIFKAPDRTQPMVSSKKIFLAGSIDMGEAEDWQATLTKNIEDLSEKSTKNVTIFNPRRDDWDSSWEQDINNTQFYDQVTWELDRIDDSDLVIFYFGKDSKSPITLLELGKVSELKDKTVLVYCPKGFYRKGNVDITCHRKKIPVFEELHDLIKEVGTFLKVEKLESEPADSEKSKEKTHESMMEKPVGFQCPSPRGMGDVSNVPNGQGSEVKTLLEDNQIKLKSLQGDPIMEFTRSVNNFLFVEDFEHIENSCMMGKIKFKGRTIYSGICNEDGKTKVSMNIMENDGTERLVEFELIKTSDMETAVEESIFLSDSVESPE